VNHADFVERVAKSLRFDGSDLSEERREEIWGKLGNRAKEYWREWVRFVLREIEAAKVDRSPKGQDRETGGRDD
jgi:hypothetical protein